MGNSAALTKDRNVAKENVSVEISKVSVTTIGVISGIIGCWAVACLISGMISTGGPGELIKGFITAITG